MKDQPSHSHPHPMRATPLAQPEGSAHVHAGATPNAPDSSVAQRLKSQFAPAYLTVASIIQGVALSALVVRVEGTYVGFDAVAWLLTATTFLVIVTIWHKYLMIALAYVWLPTLLDSLTPFGFVVAELFLGHNVYGNMRGWLLAYAGCGLVGFVAWIQQNAQARLLASENRPTNDVLAGQERLRASVSLGISGLSIAAWALYDALHLDQAQLAIAILALIAIIAFLASSAPGWNRLLAYALRER
jgi:hypothetical protein